MHIIEEENYRDTWKHKIVPRLDRCRKEVFYERVAGQPIKTMWYEADHARGTVLISHGFTEGCRKYDEPAYYLLNAGYNVIVLAHCGHDHSYRLVEDLSLVHVDSYTRYVDDLLYAARKIRWHFRHIPLFLLGHSMGGGIAAAAAEKAPGLFQGLILSSPMIQPDTGLVPFPAAQTIAVSAVSRHREKEYCPGHGPYKPEVFEKSCMTSPARFDVDQQRRQQDPYLQTSGASLGWLLEAGRMERAVFANEHKLNMPVLLVQAELDNVVSNPMQNLFFSRLPKSIWKEKVVIEQAKHEIYNSQGQPLQIYWDTILNFLQLCETKSSWNR